MKEWIVHGLPATLRSSAEQTFSTTRHGFLSIGVSMIVCLAAATAQQAVTFSPNPAVPGQPVDITIHDTASQPFLLTDPCHWVEIHAGSQTGPIVPFEPTCISILITVAPNESFTFQWNQIDFSTGQPVPVGRYWIRATTFNSAFAQGSVHWACIDVQGPNEPALTAGTPTLQVGVTTPFAIHAPSYPNAFYAIVFAPNSNLPVSVPGVLDLCLSEPLVEVYADALDVTGTSNAYALAIPDNPSLAFSAGVFQAVIIEPATLSLTDTNALSLVVEP